MRGTVPLPCGQCLPCRINRARVWQWRQFLESCCHAENCFVTLTYSNYFFIRAKGELQPRDLQLFIKRLRKAIAPLRFRFFAVGEYGHEGQREFNPHYHLSLFGVSGLTVVQFNGEPRLLADVVAEVWGQGLTTVYEFNHDTAGYVAGYVTKKMTVKEDARLEGRYPEFARMSRRPGIGANAMHTVAGQFKESGAMVVLEEAGDVPSSLKLGRRNIPLGRYLLSRLRESVGFTPDYIQQLKGVQAYERSVEVSALLSAALDDETVATAKSAFLKEAEGRIIQTEKRAELRKQMRKL